MKIFTIGFTKKTAQEFFELLERNKVKKIVDTRINNTSQLSSFAKGKDLEYFARRILNIDCEHVVDFAPTNELLSRYRKGEISWPEYESEYIKLLDSRKIMDDLKIHSLQDACLLCSEHEPNHCHRRLLVEYIQKAYPEIEIIHLI